MLKKTWLLAVLLVSACGGGGGGGSSQLSITLTPSPLTGSFADWNTPAQITFKASVQGDATGPFYLILLDPAATFGPTVNISPINDTDANITIATAASLAIGDHPGTINFQICGDAQCKKVFGSTPLPYDVKITPNPTLTATPAPASVSGTVTQSDQPNWAETFTLQGTPDNSNSAYVTGSDPAGVLQIAFSGLPGPQPGSTLVSGSSFSGGVSLLLHTPGHYTGAIQLHFCRDYGCTQLYSGTTTLPYDITILSDTNLTPLAPLSGAPDWQTFNGNPAHSAYVPVTLNPSSFSPRWLWSAPNGNSIAGIRTPVTSGGKVYLVEIGLSGNSSVTPTLYALAEADASIAWQTPLNVAAGDVSQPGLAAGKIYLEGSAEPNDGQPPQPGHTDGFFAAFDAASGARVYNDTVNMTPGMFEPGFGGVSYVTYPTPIGGAMIGDFFGWFTNTSTGAGYNYVYGAYDQSSGVAASIPSCLSTVEQSHQLTPTAAVDAAQHAYFATDNGLLVVDLQKASCSQVAAPLSSSGQSVPILTGVGSDVLVGSPGASSLVDFDGAALSQKWSIPGEYEVYGAANGVVYAGNDGHAPFHLEARSEADGHLLWSWASPRTDEARIISMVVTNNIVFLSTDRQTYAIDTGSHQLIWSYGHGGSLALSANGILYIGGFPGADGLSYLAAINLH